MTGKKAHLLKASKSSINALAVIQKIFKIRLDIQHLARICLLFNLILIGIFLTTLCQAQPNPSWHTQTVIYQVYCEKFTSTKDLNGIESQLDYLQDLGVKTIWLMPIFEAIDEHGYNTTNYYKIASRYGTEQDLKSLVDAAHKKDMRIILDLVVNHTGTLHPWFASSNPTIRKDHWYIWADKDLQWDDPWTHDSNPGPQHANKTWFKDPFSDYDRNGDGDAHNDDYYYSVFNDKSGEIKDALGNIIGYGGTMPDLNYNDSSSMDEIVEEIKKVMDYWLKNTGIDGFRCDAARYLSEYGPGNQADQDRTHEIWKKWRAWLDVNYPNAILLAEAPTEEYSDMVKYYGDGDEFQCAFHFKYPEVLLRGIKNGSRPDNLMKGLYEIQTNLPKNTQDVLFLSNHDHFAGDRVASQLDGNKAKINLAASLYLLLSGNPSIYYGEEIGMLGAGSDSAVREPLDWTVVRGQSFEEDSILNHYRRLLKLRNQYDALKGGITYFVHAHYSSGNCWDNDPDRESPILTIIREYYSEIILVVHNFSNTDEQVHVSLDCTGLSISNGTAAYSLMGDVPAYPVSSTNRNWFDIGLVHPKCTKVVYLGDISKYQSSTGQYVTYENALQDGDNSITIHYKENIPSPGYYLHAWDDNGLVCQNKLPMQYEGKFNGEHWWWVTVSNMPDDFCFCFVDDKDNWDGYKREYKKQSTDIYTKANFSQVDLSRN